MHLFSNRLFSAVMFFAVSALQAQTAAGGKSRPNILFIMTDQHRWDCIAANGNKIIKTPNLDRLASRGANFTHAFVSSPVCVPSRISFFTGRYAHSHKNRVNYTPLDRNEVLMQARFKEAGYSTAAVGKLHYYPPNKEEALRTGFDYAELHDGSAITDLWSEYVRWLQEVLPNRKAYYRATAKNIEPGKNPFRSMLEVQHTDTAWTGERSRAVLKELVKDDRPFFYYVSFWKPHSPYEVAAPYDSMYDGVEIPIPETVSLETVKGMPLPVQKLALRNGEPKLDRERLEWAYRSYYGTISHVDYEIGLLLNVLESSGKAENTLIVFSSDHGDQLFEHAITDKNCFYDPSVRVPFMISLPGRIKSAQHEQLIETVDLLPTLLEFTGIPEPREVQGRSFAPLIAEMGRTYEPHAEVFSENIIPEVITGGKTDMPFEKGRGVGGIRHPDAKMVRTQRWKYCYYPEGYTELYDIKADPLETRNLAGKPEMREVEFDLRTRLLNWLINSQETDQIQNRWMLPEKK